MIVEIKTEWKITCPKSMERLLICGPREIKNYLWVKENVFLFLDDHPTITMVIHGAAVGVDSLSDRAVKEYNKIKGKCIFILPVKPNYLWYGSPAPFIRNKQMVDIANITLALHNGKDGGTRDTINHSRRKGIPIIIVLYPRKYNELQEINKWF